MDYPAFGQSDMPSREKFKSAFASDTIIGQYTFGTPENSVSPDGYSLDIFYTQRDGYAEIQSDLIFDYQNNVKLYPKFQKYLREYQPKLLAVWGKNDPSFVWKGAEAFKKDLPNAEIHSIRRRRPAILIVGGDALRLLFT